MTVGFDVSNRIKHIPASSIRKLTPYAIEAKKQGVKVYHLNIGDPDIETPGVMLSVLRNWDIKTVSYSPSQGDPAFLKSLVSYYHKLGYSYIDTSHIQVTSGGSEGISMALYAICDPKDEVIVFEPFYANYSAIATINDVKIIPIATEARNGFHLPGKNTIEYAVNKKTKAILICTPNNPTGTVYSKKEMDMLVSLCNKHGLFLIVDEVYREFIYDKTKHISVLDYMNKYPDKMILLDSVSKRYSLCGARLGMLVSLNRDIMAGALKMGQSRLSSGFVDQAMAAKLTEVSTEYTRNVNKEYKKRRDLIYREVKKIPGVFLEKPQGAFYAVVRLPVKNSEDFCRWLLTDFRYKNETVMLAPAAGFYGTPGKGVDEVRLAYVLSRESLRRAILILKQALHTYASGANIS